MRSNELIIIVSVKFNLSINISRVSSLVRLSCIYLITYTILFFENLVKILSAPMRIRSFRLDMA